MRTPNDTCLLCKTEKATKKNSHIISKFLGKSILGTDNKKISYTIDTEITTKLPKKSQDSPKENYLLCPTCEDYLAHIENYYSNHIHDKILNIKFNNEFKYQTSSGSIEFVECISSRTAIIRLFSISLFWRANISSSTLFKRFKIEEQEEFRSLLNKYRIKTYAELQSLKFEEDIYTWPITLFRVKSSKDSTKNIINSKSDIKNVYLLLLNEYSFGISTKQNSVLNKFDFLTNVGNNNFKIAILGTHIWDGLIKQIINQAAEISVENSRKNRTRPFWENE